MAHPDVHPLRGQTVTLHDEPFVVEDWWDRVSRDPWSMDNPAYVMYAYEAIGQRSVLPPDHNVVYGHFGRGGRLVHQSEIGEPL